MVYKYNFRMGIKIGDTPIPDPSEWEYQVGDLDTSGSRDATGYLHRAYVATKINYGFSWNNLEWEMLQVILKAVNAKPEFTLTAPDPRTFNTMYEGTYYVNDRTGKAQYYMPDDGEGASRTEIASYTLKLKFIEY